MHTRDNNEREVLLFPCDLSTERQKLPAGIGETFNQYACIRVANSALSLSRATIRATAPRARSDAYPIVAWPENGQVLLSTRYRGQAVSSVTRMGSIAVTNREARRSPARAAPHSSRFAHYVARPFLQLGPILFALAITTAIFMAWFERDEGRLTAESGVGYWLGIAGAIVMLLLVAYPLRKRFRAFHGMGRVANWFRFHMILGIIGPTLVILHTNFKLGSLNSRLALFTMLTVVASGIVGRYLYAKIHKGLYGKQAELRDVLSDIMTLKQELGAELAGQSGIRQELERYTPKDGFTSPSFVASVVSAALAGVRARSSRRRIRREVKLLLSRPEQQRSTRRQRRAKMREIDAHLRIFFAAVKKAQRLAFFERLFGMWHHLHMPLFVLLALTVVIHVVAVHLY